jgi:hypothetical protein
VEQHALHGALVDRAVVVEHRLEPTRREVLDRARRAAQAQHRLRREHDERPTRRA